MGELDTGTMGDSMRRHGHVMTPVRGSLGVRFEEDADIKARQRAAFIPLDRKGAKLATIMPIQWEVGYACKN